MKYKAFFCDFDGTLCTRDEYVSPANREAIKKYIAAGGRFILNTGRMTAPTHKILCFARDRQADRTHDRV